MTGRISKDIVTDDNGTRGQTCVHAIITYSTAHMGIFDRIDVFPCQQRSALLFRHKASAM